MNRLKQLREAQELSQKEFAKAFNRFISSNKKYALYDGNGKEKSISNSIVSRWENEKAPIPSIYFAALADYFDVTVPYFKGSASYPYFEGSNLYKIYIYCTTYGDCTFLVVAKSRKQADEMLSSEISWNYEPDDFAVTTYPVDKPMIDEI